MYELRFVVIDINCNVVVIFKICGLVIIVDNVFLIEIIIVVGVIIICFYFCQQDFGDDDEEQEVLGLFEYDWFVIDMVFDVVIGFVIVFGFDFNEFWKIFEKFIFKFVGFEVENIERFIGVGVIVECVVNMGEIVIFYIEKFLKLFFKCLLDMDQEIKSNVVYVVGQFIFSFMVFNIYFFYYQIIF